MSGGTIAWLILLKVSGLGILYLALASAVVLRMGRGPVDPSPAGEGGLAPRREPGGVETSSFGVVHPTPVGFADSALPFQVRDQAAVTSRDRSRGDERGSGIAAPAVTIMKPLHGAEPGLAENLASFVEQDYAAPVQVILGVQNASDPALAVARDLQARFPEHDIALVVDGRQHGTNRKVSNLANMAERAKHELIVLADSDMRVGPDYLAGLAATLAAPGTGAVTCLYHGLPEATLPARLMALAIDSHFLPGVAMGVGLGIGHPCMGSTIALRRETLERIGGFHSVADELADDHALGARVRALGLKVAVTRFTVGHVCPDLSVADLAAQELRWMRTIRQIEPAGHAGAVLSHPLPFALLAFGLGPGPIAAAVAFTAIAARIGLCLAVGRAFGVKPHPYWLVPARDLLSFAVYLASYLGRGVSWRGYRYEVARSGALLPTTRPDAP